MTVWNWGINSELCAESNYYLKSSRGGGATPWSLKVFASLGRLCQRCYLFHIKRLRCSGSSDYKRRLYERLRHPPLIQTTPQSIGTERMFPLWMGSLRGSNYVWATLPLMKYRFFFLFFSLWTIHSLVFPVRRQRLHMYVVVVGTIWSLEWPHLDGLGVA